MKRRGETSPCFSALYINYNSNFVYNVRWQTGNGANFSLFWEREAKGILPKKAEVIIWLRRARHASRSSVPAPFFFGSFLFGRTKRNEHKKKCPFEIPSSEGASLQGRGM